MTKMASEGQQNYIATLVRTRAGNPKTCGALHYTHGRHMVPYLALDDWTIESWIDTLTFDQAKEVLGYLVSLPEPEQPPKASTDGQITSAQRSKCWAILKALNCNTYRAWLLRKDDPDIPHLRWDDTNTSVWDWLSGLTVTEASETIEHLEAVQKIVRGH